MTDAKVTGKKLLYECLTLAKDLGIFMFEVTKAVYFRLKAAVAANERPAPNGEPAKD